MINSDDSNEAGILKSSCLNSLYYHYIIESYDFSNNLLNAISFRPLSLDTSAMKC